MSSMENNYQFFMEANIDPYIGQWVAICDRKIVAYGKNVKKVFKEANEKCPGKRPLITRVPDKAAMIF